MSSSLFVALFFVLHVGLCLVYTTEVWFHSNTWNCLGGLGIIWEGVCLSISLGALMPAPFFILTRKYLCIMWFNINICLYWMSHVGIYFNFMWDPLFAWWDAGLNDKSFCWASMFFLLWQPPHSEGALFMWCQFYPWLWGSTGYTWQVNNDGLAPGSWTRFIDPSHSNGVGHSWFSPSLSQV